MLHHEENPRAFAHRLIESLPHPAALLDETGSIIAANDSFQALIHQSHHTCIGTPITKLIASSDVKKVICYLATARPKGGEIRTSVRTGTLDADLHIKRIETKEDPTHFLCNITTETEEINVRSRFFLEHADQGVWDYDARTGTLIVSDAWRRMRGTAESKDTNATNPNWMDLIHPDDHGALLNLFQEQPPDAPETIKIQYRHKHRKGHWVWILCRARIMESDGNNKPLRIVGTDTDITLVKKAETDLQQLASKLQLAIEASGMGIWEFNPANLQVLWDNRMLEIYALENNKSDQSEYSWEDFIHPDDREETLAYAERCSRENATFNATIASFAKMAEFAKFEVLRDLSQRKTQLTNLSE